MNILDIAQHPELIPAVASYHQKMIDSFQSMLGQNHLRRMYENIVLEKTGKVLVALQDQNIVGIISAVTDLDSMKAKALNQVRAWDVIKGLSKRPVFFIDVLDHFLSLPYFKKSKGIYLSSLAVDESALGMLASIRLMKQMKDVAANYGGVISSLVRKNNTRALKFYAGCGFARLKNYITVCLIRWQA